MVTRNQRLLPQPPEPRRSAAARARALGPLLVLAVLILVPAPSRAQQLSVVGTVQDDQGRPIKGAEVTLYPALTRGDQRVLLTTGTAYPEAEDRAVTDREGRFRLTAHETGFWTVLARAEGRFPMEYPLSPLLGATELEPVELPSAVPLSVLAVDGEGRPVPDAVVVTIRLRRTSYRAARKVEWRRPQYRVAVADETGRVDLPRLADEKVALRAALRGSAPGLFGTATMEAAPAGAPGPTQIVLEAAPTLRLQVLAPNGRPVPGAAVWQGLTLSAGATDAEGLVDLPLRPESPTKPVRVFVDAPDGLIADTEVHLPPEDDEEARRPPTIRLTPVPTASGQVIEAGTGHGIVGALVWSQVEPAAAVRTDRGGFFQVPIRLSFSGHRGEVAAPGFLPATFPLDSAPQQDVEGLTVVLERSVSLRGRVLSPAGEPVPGARVMSGPEASRLLPAILLAQEVYGEVTAADGTFEIDLASADELSVVIVAEGYVPLLKADLGSVGRNDVMDLGDLVLEPEGSLAGQVVDSEGEPVPGASVRTSQTLPNSGHLPAWPVPRASTETDADGAFRVDGFAPDRPTHLQVDKEDYVSASVKVSETAGDEPLTIVLYRCATVVVAVVDQEGQPVPQAGVSSPAFSIPGGGSFSSESTGEGIFKLTGFRSGRVSFRVEAPGYQTSEPVTLELSPGEQREGVRVVLQRGVAVTGRVLDPDGRPAAHAELSATEGDAEGTFSSWRHEVAQGDGSFSVEGLAPGRLLLEAHKEGFANAKQEIEVGPGGASVELRLGRGTEVTGWVLRSDGSPAIGQALQLSPNESSGLNAARLATTNSDGRFTFRVVRDGEHKLTVTEGRTAWTFPESIRVEGGVPVTDLELRLPGTATLTGLLLGLEPGDLDGIVVEARAPGKTSWGGLIGEVRSDGSYRIDGLTPGSWTVTAGSSRGGPRATSQVEIAEGQSEASLDLELSRGHTITGTVTSGGQPVPGATVTGTSVESWYSSTTTSLDGRFRLDGVPAGRATFRARDPRSGATTFRNAEVDGDQDIQIDLDEASQVRGLVLAAESSLPVPRAMVWLELEPEEGKPSFPGSPRAVTGADGTFLLIGVPSGRAKLEIRKQGYAPFTTEVEVVGSDVQVAPVLLEPAGEEDPPGI